MKQLLFILLFLFCSLTARAHQVDASTTMLMEQEDGSWTLQVRAALTAFQQEVRTHFGEDAYATPEEFQQLVIDHLRENIRIAFNQEGAVVLQQPNVRLGHETIVLFHLENVPSIIKSVVVSNTSFEDIHHSQSALVVLKQGFTQDRFVLSDANKHTASLTIDESRFVAADSGNTSFGSLGLLLAGLGVMVLFGGFKISRTLIFSH